MNRVLAREPAGRDPAGLAGLRISDPDRLARACRARAVVLDLEGHPEDAQQLRDLADTITSPPPMPAGETPRRTPA